MPSIPSYAPTLVGSALFLSVTTLPLAAQTQWVERIPATLPTPRLTHVMVHDVARAQTLIFGGSAGAPGFLADTWLWDGCAWTSPPLPCCPPPPVPPATARAAGALHPPTGNIVMFGGSSGGFLATTWTWNGTLWTQANPTTTPPARDSHAMAFDGTNVMMFGGAGITIALGDTWLWNGSNWTPAPTTSPPPPMPAARDNHAMAHDPGQGTVVLFGGRNNPSGFLGDTWLWNGTTQSWTQATPANAPTARQSHSMAFDATLGVVVLTGGVGAGGNLADVWHWNGANWTQAAGAFPARYGHGTAYDQTRSELLLTGGISLVADTHVREHALVTMPAACRLFGPGCAGPSGALPRMGTDTCPRIGQTFTLQFTNLPVSPGVIGVDTAATTIGNGACAWHLGAGAPVVFPYTGTSASHAIPIPNIVGLVGTLFFNQAAALDGGGLALSNSSEARIGL